MSGINYNGGHCCHFQILLKQIRDCQFRDGLASPLRRKRVLNGGVSGKVGHAEHKRLNSMSSPSLRKTVLESQMTGSALCNRDFLPLCPKKQAPIPRGNSTVVLQPPLLLGCPSHTRSVSYHLVDLTSSSRPELRTFLAAILLSLSLKSPGNSPLCGMRNSRC